MLRELLQIGDFDIAYDGIRLADHLVVRGVDMPLLPEITANSISIDGKAGEWFTSRQIGTRDITVRLGMLGETKDRVEALDNWINHSFLVGKDAPCRLDLGNHYWVKAIMVGNSDITRNGKWSVVDVTFRCFDPYLYGDTHTITLKSGSNTVEILGNAPTAPIFAVKNSSSSSYLDIEDNKTRKKVRIYNTGTTNTITVDMGLHKCLIGSTYKAVDPTTTDFFTLEPGNQTVNIKSGTGTMTYTEVYL